MITVGRDALGRRQFKTERVKVEEWGGQVILRAMTSAEQEHVQGYAIQAVDTANTSIRSARPFAMMARAAVVHGWIDEDGNNVLTMQDIKLLENESNTVVARLASIVMRLSGVSDKLIPSVATGDAADAEPEPDSE